MKLPAGYEVTLNGEPATYDPETGVVSSKRLLGSLNYNIEHGQWLDYLTFHIDGKIIKFYPTFEVELFWCEACRSYHADPLNHLHKELLKCKKL
jgi:hypothetical protein